MQLAGNTGAGDKPSDFIIWGTDDAAYGPVELPMLVDWVRDDRVLESTWVFSRATGTWQRASTISELKLVFGRKLARNKAPAAQGAITPGAMRRIKILSDMTDTQLEQLSQFMITHRVPQWSVIVKKGDPGSAMFVILEGELRVRAQHGDQETILATLGPGEFFGDMSLFDQGPRSADVVANVDSTVLEISAAAFNQLVQEMPAVATPFLQATARTMAARIRADNKRLDRLTEQFHSGAI